MAASKDLYWIGESDPVFRGRCLHYALKAGLAYLALQSPTDAQVAFAKAAILGTLDAGIVARAALTNATVAAMANPAAVSDNDLEYVIVTEMAPVLAMAMV
jgi:hypothetical protein